MTIRKKIKWWLKRKWKRFLFKRGWRYCPICRKFARILWVKEVVLFEDEPPMFYRWQCQNCGAKTPVIPTGLTISAVTSLGYEDFDAYCKKLMEKNVGKQEA